MLNIDIRYDSKWGNSFLDGDNNSPAPKSGRNYIASNSSISKNNDNFIRREITIDTVMGVLNRLIGDQKKLYQAREYENYFFKDIENNKLVSFLNEKEYENEELIYLRNLSGSTDQNSFSGTINVNDVLFSSEASKYLWGVLYLDLESLCNFILDENYKVDYLDADPLKISDYYNEVVSKYKGIKFETSELPYLNKILEAEKFLSDKFNQVYRNNKGDQIQVYSLYCSALYIQIERLKRLYTDIDLVNERGNIPGFSKKGFTLKDFMKKFTSGNGKLVFGNPYFKETMVKGEGKVKEGLKKSGGILKISIDVDFDKSCEIKKMIEDAGVMSFRLGKKGLAYVSKMKVV